MLAHTHTHMHKKKILIKKNYFDFIRLQVMKSVRVSAKPATSVGNFKASSKPSFPLLSISRNSSFVFRVSRNFYSSGKFRIEKDTMGELEVPSEKYWGCQTQRLSQHKIIFIGMKNNRAGPAAAAAPTAATKKQKIIIIIIRFS